MLFSQSLFKRYINIKDEPENIADYLTLKTCEIEEIKKRYIPKKVVIWYVIKCEKHPDADKLFITSVDCWDKWTFQVVTWAENVKKDMYVAMALNGCYLPAKDLTIKPVQMRGVDSIWMLCSKSELWIQEDLDLHGIWDLEKDLNTLDSNDFWKPLIFEVPFLDNYIFDIDNKTLTNRPDLTWHLWQAIELHCIYKNFKKDAIFMDDISNTFNIFQDINIFETLQNVNKSDKNVSVNSSKVRAYLTLDIKDVVVWKTVFKDRLDLIDLWEQTINNYVDFSNLFMLLTSQPIHFFDADKIQWDIKVKEASGWEKFTDLTWKEYSLNAWDIIIVDDQKILALAWVIWWKWSEVTENTKNIKVEIWNFDPIQIRKTWNNHNLRTNWKIRFEKDINPLFSLYTFILFLDQFKLSWLYWKIWWVFSYYQESVKKIYLKNVEVDCNELKDFSWIKNIEDEHIKNILENIWFKIYNKNCKIPCFRSNQDINIKEDVFEEIIRIYGYENIVWENLTKDIEYVDFDKHIELNRLVEKIFVEKFNFNLIETYPRFDLNLSNRIKTTELDNLYSLINPSCPEFKYLRGDIYTNLLWVIEKNFRYFDYIKVLETWQIFHKSFWEKTIVWACIYKSKIESWKDNNIFELKSVVKDLLKEYDLKGFLDFSIENNGELEVISHPKQFAIIKLNNKIIWKIFTLHPYYNKEFKFPDNSQITFLELDLSNILELKNNKKIKSVKSLNYYTLEDQIVERDLSFIISKKDYYKKVLFAIWNVKEIIDFEVFDLYDLNDSKSISLKIRIYGKNMDTEYINSIMDKAIKAVEKSWWKLR